MGNGVGVRGSIQEAKNNTLFLMIARPYSSVVKAWFAWNPGHAACIISSSRSFEARLVDDKKVRVS